MASRATTGRADLLRFAQAAAAIRVLPASGAIDLRYFCGCVGLFRFMSAAVASRVVPASKHSAIVRIEAAACSAPAAA